MSKKEKVTDHNQDVSNTFGPTFTTNKINRGPKIKPTSPKKVVFSDNTLTQIKNSNNETYILGVVPEFCYSGRIFSDCKIETRSPLGHITNQEEKQSLHLQHIDKLSEQVRTIPINISNSIHSKVVDVITIEDSEIEENYKTTVNTPNNEDIHYGSERSQRFNVQAQTLYKKRHPGKPKNTKSVWGKFIIRFILFTLHIT